MSKLTPTGLAAAAATILGAGALLMAPQVAPGSESSHSLPLQFGLGAAVVVTTLVGARLTWGRVRAPLALEGWPEDRAAWARKLGVALAACLVISFVAKQFVPVEDLSTSVPAVPEVSWAGLLGAAVAWVIIAPLAEELFFRGYLFRLARDAGLGFWVTALLVTLLWIGVHPGRPWPMTLALALIGLTLAALRERSGRLLVPLAMHAAFNLYHALLFIAASLFLAG